jgi:hypothetical protein
MMEGTSFAYAALQTTAAVQYAQPDLSMLLPKPQQQKEPFATVAHGSKFL